MKVLFFSRVRQDAGCASLELPLQQATVPELWKALIEVQPALASYRSQVRLARNNEFVGDDAIFRANDEIALIPPVSGG